jgi:tetratricopeptide (TPR) repeat protein
MLATDEDTPISAQVIAVYQRGGEKKEISLIKPLVLYNRNAINWAYPENISAFVTHNDFKVKSFTRRVLGLVKEEVIGVDFSKAMKIFAALNTLGISYVEDPSTPFREISLKEAVLDSIQYPRETLSFKSGDCDDLSVLYASCLENVGIETAFINVPGHIFLMFNTGIHEKNAYLLTLDKNAYILKENHVWLPIEVTEIGSSFVEAWLKGVEEYRRWEDSRELEVVEVRKSWEIHPPMPLPSDMTEPEVPPSEKIAAKLNEYIEQFLSYKERTASLLVERYKEQVKSNPNDLSVRNELGIIYGKAGLIEQAKEEFLRIIEIEPTFAPSRNNLGNIYCKAGEYDLAEGEYIRAKELDKEDGGIYFNLGAMYYIQGKKEEALDMFREGFKKFPSFREAFSVLGIDILEEEVFVRGDPKRITEDEVKRLLREALEKVPELREEKEERREEMRAVFQILMGPKGRELTRPQLLHEMFYYWKETK